MDSTCFAAFICFISFPFLFCHSTFDYSELAGQAFFIAISFASWQKCKQCHTSRKAHIKEVWMAIITQHCVCSFCVDLGGNLCGIGRLLLCHQNGINSNQEWIKFVSASNRKKLFGLFMALVDITCVVT